MYIQDRTDMIYWSYIFVYTRIIMTLLDVLKNRLSYSLKYASGKYQNLVKLSESDIDESSVTFQAGYYKGILDYSKANLEVINDIDGLYHINKYGIELCRLVIKVPISNFSDYYVPSNQTYYKIGKGFYSEEHKEWIEMEVTPEIMNETFGSLIDLNMLRAELSSYKLFASSNNLF